MSYSLESEILESLEEIRHLIIDRGFIISEGYFKPIWLAAAEAVPHRFNDTETRIFEEQLAAVVALTMSIITVTL
ncbi:MAG: hypothetical protein Q9201_000044 [Fulgogasparrea decipioides]